MHAQSAVAKLMWQSVRAVDFSLPEILQNLAWHPDSGAVQAAITADLWTSFGPVQTASFSAQLCLTIGS